MIAERLKHGRTGWLDSRESEKGPIRYGLFSVERLEQHAGTLAEAQEVRGGYEGRKLMPRVRENARVLSDSYQAIARAVAEGRAIAPAAEWLLDNFHVVEQLNDINDHLPEGYYREPPKLANGFLSGYLRVYRIAWALVAHTDSRFAPEPLAHFVRAYQRIRPLTIGQRRAIPNTLRVVMVENRRRLAIVILSSQIGCLLADGFVDQVEKFVAQVDQSYPPPALAVLPAAPLRQAYAVLVIQRLHQPHPGATPSLDFLNDWLAEARGDTGHAIGWREQAGKLKETVEAEGWDGTWYRRGGWTWYTGAAGWFYRSGLEWILGLRVYTDQLYFDPCIPRTWRSYTMRYQHEDTCYQITVENPAGVAYGVARLELDGTPQTTGNTIPLVHDGKVHRVLVVLGAKIEPWRDGLQDMEVSAVVGK